MNEGDIIVRTATPGDADAVRAIYAPVVERTPISFETDAPTREEIQARIERTTDRLPWLVGAIGDVVVGYACAAPHRARDAYRWSVDTSVYIAADHRHEGIGKLLYNELIDRLIELGYVNAYAGIALPNEASVALHESMGYRRVGVFPMVGFKLGTWHDVGWWWLPLREPPRSPAEPAGYTA